MEPKSTQNLTPAALAAFARGDMDNFAVAATPGGIEAQEKAGQTSFVANSQLPKDCPRDDLEKLGFKFGKDVDDIFVSVLMPPGWKKVATDHSMWSDMVDDKGRKRGSIFYKAAFYDRNAHMRLAKRYCITDYKGCDKAGTAADPNDYNAPYRAVVIEDCGSEIHRIGIVRQNAYADKSKMVGRAEAWLNEHFPQWREATAYWDGDS